MDITNITCVKQNLYEGFMNNKDVTKSKVYTLISQSVV